MKRSSITQTTFGLLSAVALLLPCAPAWSQTDSSAPAPAPPPSAASAMTPMAVPFFWNPYAWINYPRVFMAPGFDATQIQMLGMMMRAMNPQMMFGWQPPIPGGSVVPSVPPMIPGFPTQSRRHIPANTVTGEVTREAKRNLFQSMMMFSPLALRDLVGIMAEKMLVAEDVTFDDAVDSMKLRANEINFKFVGHNPLWKDVRAITGDEDTPRVEIFQFCDAVVARKILDYVPEFLVFLPCRIALSEDADGRIWVMTLDWDVSWLDYAQNPNSDLGKELRADATRIRDGIRYIMEGVVTGDF